ncbi:MAG: tetratricopeptide repeat protein [Chitinophagaceae bacterium]
MKYFLLFISIIGSVHLSAQNKFIYKGNESYKNKQYDDAVKSYGKALVENGNDTIAQFNMANALFRDKREDEAIKAFDGMNMSAAAWYNKGVVLTRQKKLKESIEAYKHSLRLNPDDSLARENLQRALQEQKQKDEQQQKEDQQKKDQQKQKNKLSKQQVEQLLKALEEQEKKLLDRMQKSRVAGANQPEKDW